VRRAVAEVLMGAVFLFAGFGVVLVIMLVTGQLGPGFCQ